MSDSILYAGIDIGSSYTKVVLIDQNNDIQGSNIDFSGIKLHSAAETSLKAALPKNTNLTAVKKIVTTGFGRKIPAINQIPFSNITEISCSAKAAQLFYPNKTLTIIDIGGQDTKMISMRNGKRTNFKMNRKCAAGTGTFIEELALKLRIDLGEMNTLASKSTNPEKISSYCTVFAASEVLSRIRKGAKIEDMIYGAFYSIVNRVLEIDTINTDVVLTGGLIAYNPIIADIFKEVLGKSMLLPPSPQLFVALGAALYASQLK